MSSKSIWLKGHVGAKIQLSSVCQIPCPEIELDRPEEGFICVGLPLLNMSQGAYVFQRPLQGPDLLHCVFGNPAKGRNKGDECRLSPAEGGWSWTLSNSRAHLT